MSELGQKSSVVLITINEAEEMIEQHTITAIKYLECSEIADAMDIVQTMVKTFEAFPNSLTCQKRLVQKAYPCFDKLIQTIVEVSKKDPNVDSFHENVQYIPTALSRVYLLVTVEAAFMLIPGYDWTELFKDMVEMSKAVQTPVLSITQRSYILRCVRPHLKSVIAKKSSDVSSILKILINNFAEMNKLWIRIKYMRGHEPFDAIETDRSEAGVLVGEIFEIVNELTPHLNSKVFKEEFLAVISKHIILCNDRLTQESLLNSLLIFSSGDLLCEAIVCTLNSLSQLHRDAQKLHIIGHVANRVCDQVKLIIQCQTKSHESEMLAQAESLFEKSFKMICDSIPPLNVVKESWNVTEKDLIELFSHFIHLQSQFFTSSLKLSVLVINQMATYFSDTSLASAESFILHNKLTKILHGQDDKALYHLVFETKFALLVDCMNNQSSSFFTSYLIQRFDEYSIKFSNCEQLEAVMNILKPLFRRTGTPEPLDSVLFSPVDSSLVPLTKSKTNANAVPGVVSNCCSLASFVHLIQADTPSDHLKLLKKFHETFVRSQFDPQSASVVIEALTYEIINSCFKQDDDLITDAACKFALAFLGTNLGHLTSDVNVKLMVSIAQALQNCSVKIQVVYTYEFLSRAFDLFLENIQDTHKKCSVINYLIGSLSVVWLTEENREILTKNASMFFQTFLRKSDQALVLIKTSNLYCTQIPHRSSETDQSVTKVLFFRPKDLFDMMKRIKSIIQQCIHEENIIGLLKDLLYQILYFYTINGVETLPESYVREVFQLLVEKSGDEKMEDSIKQQTKQDVARINAQFEKISFKISEK